MKPSKLSGLYFFKSIIYRVCLYKDTKCLVVDGDTYAHTVIKYHKLRKYERMHKQLGCRKVNPVLNKTEKAQIGLNCL